MSTVLKITKSLKLEKDAVYLIKFNYEPNLEQIRAIQEQFAKMYDKCGAYFVVLGSTMDVIAPENIFESPKLRKAISEMVREELMRNEIRSAFIPQS